MAQYVVVHGLDYTTDDGDGVRAEPDDVVDDLPASAIEHLLAQGSIFDPNAEPELEDLEVDDSEALLADAEPIDEEFTTTDDDDEGGE